MGKFCFLTLSSINGKPNENGIVRPTPKINKPKKIVAVGPKLETLLVQRIS